ncbi:MAG: thioredoxin family protein [Oscillospiraceae bacterium]|nr:thioredoxin family protein [Oscillospiraceae bacterium]
MKKVEIFYLRSCPYCVKAKKAVQELVEEDENYARVPVKWVNEAEEADYAGEHDYERVPAVFYSGRKYFEARPGDSLEKIREGIRKAMDQSLYEGPENAPGSSQA